MRVPYQSSIQTIRGAESRGACRPTQVLARACVTALALFLASPAFAVIHCSGQITNSYVDSVGNVVILGTWLNGYQQICNVNTTWNGVSPTTCKGWLSIVELVTISGKTAILQMDDTVTSCSSIPNYASSPAPTYVMLQQ
jgi:hypothetical protein